MRLKEAIFVLPVACALACGEVSEPPTADAGSPPPPDAGGDRLDASTPEVPDAGLPDAGVPDAGALDAGAPDAGPTGVDLSVRVTGAKSSSVDLCVAVFNSGAGFPDNASAAIFRGCKPLAQQPLVVPGLTDGATYGVSIFLDENRNQQLDKSPLGFPSEGFGFSRDPAIGFSAPKWSDVSFQLASSTSAISIKVVYCSITAGGCK